MTKRIIVSAANDHYFPLLLELISSIEDAKGSADVAIGVLDVGLTAQQRGILSARVQRLVAPGWDYPIPALGSLQQKFRAMTARPHLPLHFPGYETIMWIDADAWIQRWPAVEHFFGVAASGSLAVCQEMDRSYANVYGLNNGRSLFVDSLKVYGDEMVARVASLPMVNSGVFAMRADAPYWSDWRDTLGAVIRKGFFDHLTEQTALNVCVYSRQPLPYFMPARFNWVCVHALPRFDRQSLLYVEPAVPHDEISIVHLAGVHTRVSQPTVVDLQGNATDMDLRHSQWKQIRQQKT